MRLIFLYGPPAVGKYTIAKALAEKTGYKLFHNHLTRDLVLSIFDSDNPHAAALTQKIRLDVFEEGAKQNIPGLIFTYVYAKGDDDQFIEQLLARMHVWGATVEFIQLYGERDTLLKRVTDESRKEFKKIKSEETLTKVLKDHDIVSAIPFVKSTRIDTTNSSAEETLEEVLEILK